MRQLQRGEKEMFKKRRRSWSRRSDEVRDRGQSGHWDVFMGLGREVERCQMVSTLARQLQVTHKLTGMSGVNEWGTVSVPLQRKA